MIFLLIPIAMLLSLFQGYVVSKIGVWFGLFTITPIQGIAVALLITIFTHNLKRSDPPTDRTGDASHAEKAIVFLCHNLLALLVVWAFAYLWSLFI